MHANTVLLIAAGLGFMVWRRTRSFSRPIQGKGLRLLLPVLFIWFGLLGFMNPNLSLTLKEVCLSLLFGFILSIPMILTTNYELRDDGHIYTKKSTAFIIALIGLVLLRLALRSYLQDLDPAELGMLFYLIAVAYVIPWRVASYLKFRKLHSARGAAPPELEDSNTQEPR